MVKNKRWVSGLGIFLILATACSQKAIPAGDPSLDPNKVAVGSGSPVLACKLTCGTSAVEAVPGSVKYDPTGIGGSSAEFSGWSLETVYKASESLEVCNYYTSLALKYAVKVKDKFGLPLAKIAVKWSISGSAVSFGASAKVYKCTDACGVSIAEITFPLKDNPAKAKMPGNKFTLSVSAYSGALTLEETFNTEIEVKADEDCKQ